MLLMSLSFLVYSGDEINREKFSVAYPEYFENYTQYNENEHLEIKFKPKDFFIRNHKPYTLDIVICIWIFGNL